MNGVKIHIQLYADMALLYLHKTPQQYSNLLHPTSNRALP